MCGVWVGQYFIYFIIHKIDKRKSLYYACLIWAIDLVLILYSALIEVKRPLLLTLIITLFCIGQIPTTSLFPLCLNYMPHMKAKVAALVQAGRLIVSSLSLGIAGYLYQGTFRNTGIIIAIFIFLSISFFLYILGNKQIIKEIKLIP